MSFTPKPGIFKKTYSSENAARDIEALLKSDLNAFITGMNTDKPDLTLELIDDDAYVFQTLNDKVLSFNPFIFFYESGLETRSANAATEKAIVYTIALVMDLTNDAPREQGFRLLRYRECLERLFEKAWNSVNKRIRLEISAFPPDLVSINSADSHIGVGINLSFNIT